MPVLVLYVVEIDRVAHHVLVEDAVLDHTDPVAERERVDDARTDTAAGALARDEEVINTQSL